MRRFLAVRCAVLLKRFALWQTVLMITLEEFTKSLGPHAAQYTDDEIRQLQAEVRKMAQLLLAIHGMTPWSKGRERCSPQSTVDEPEKIVH